MPSDQYFGPTGTNPFTLFHERVHSILNKTYKEESYVKSMPIQEAFADFLPAYYMGTPILNINIFESVVITRNLNKAPILPLPALDAWDPHHIGETFSYTLWKLQERISKEEMTLLIRPFMDNLNQYYESFKKYKYNKTIKYLGFKYEYFIAVLKKTLKEKGRTQEADEFINEIVTKLGMDIALVDDIASSITKSDKNFLSTSNYKIMPSIVGIMVIYVEGVILYSLYDLFFSGTGQE